MSQASLTCWSVEVCGRRRMVDRARRCPSVAASHCVKVHAECTKTDAPLRTGAGEIGMSNVSINRQGIAQFLNEIQREFDRNPIKIPVQADSDISSPGLTQGCTTIYNGPVIHGDANGAQLAWGNRDVHQHRDKTEQIAPGYEAVAQAMVKVLEQLTSSGIPDEDQQDVELAANEVFAEITQPEPDHGKIRRAVSVIKGALAPVAMGFVKGSATGADEWARTAIEQLSKHL